MIIDGKEYPRGEHIIDGQRVVVVDEHTAVTIGPAPVQKTVQKPAKKARKKAAKK